MSIKLRQLSHVLALDEHGSFSRAAASLHISQPALSRSIQTMEAQTGAPLFLRQGHGVVPTDLGRVLIEHARQITHLADNLHARLVGNPAVACQELVIGAGPFPAGTVIGKAVAGFVGACPGVKLRVEVRNWDELLPRLRDQQLDLFVAETSTLEQEADLQVQPLPRHPLYFLARPGHPLAGAQAGLAQVLHWPIATVARIPPRMLEPALTTFAGANGQPGGTKPFPALACTDISLVKRVVASSDTIMASSLGCVARELERNELVVLGAEPWMQLNYGVVTLANRLPASPAVVEFRALLAEAERAVCAEEAALVARWVPVPGPAAIGNRQAEPALSG